ncbi:MAG: hypothetical protein JSU63_16810 [Phycisphaerales bacterium]|nr:MAG: hypothetical protein JSU63_16810 [Phycisphaerales bacterium]
MCKKYVSDVDHGGGFLDLEGMRVTNRQLKRAWFCGECDNEVLSKTENYAARFCERIEGDPTTAHIYDEHLLRFAVSISWRVAKGCMEESTSQQEREMLKKPSRRWKEFLRDERPNILPYSQHLFVVFDNTGGLHKALRGAPFFDERLLLSQVGPLFLVGLLDRTHLSLKDIAVWGRSEIDPAGGTLSAISEWRVGENVTEECASLFGQHEIDTTRRILGMRRRGR